MIKSGWASPQRGPDELSPLLRRASFTGWCGLLLSLLPIACVPEQPLASYEGGGALTPYIENPQGASGPDASLGGATRPNRPDPPIVGGPPSTRPDAALIDALDAGSDDAIDGPDVSAVLPATLVCRAECTCERRANRDFMFCGAAVTHGEAVELCATAGGTLVIIDDQEQNAWVSRRMEAAAASTDFWLSGTDSDDEGVWRWPDGRVFFDATIDAGNRAPYVPWDDGQPNDLGGEDCMRLTGGLWLDLPCESELAFACQG
jgi:hypothetical protein